MGFSVGLFKIKARRKTIYLVITCGFEINFKGLKKNAFKVRSQRSDLKMSFKSHHGHLPTICICFHYVQ